MTPATTSGKAIASMALAALTLCLWSFTELPALVVLPIGAACIGLALLGLRDIRRSEGRLAGRRLAIGAGVAQSVAVFVFLALLPAIEKIREARERLAVA